MPIERPLVSNKRASRDYITEALSAAAMLDQFDGPATNRISTARPVAPVGSGPVAPGGLSEATFNQALQKLLAAAGGKVKLVSGKRSTQRQAQLWANALKKYGSPEKARKWVAPPGRSNHERGLAADLGGDLEYAAKIAAQFGLYRPLANEPWHFELRGTRGKK